MRDWSSLFFCSVWRTGTCISIIDVIFALKRIKNTKVSISLPVYKNRKKRHFTRFFVSSRENRCSSWCFCVGDVVSWFLLYAYLLWAYDCSFHTCMPSMIFYFYCFSRKNVHLIPACLLCRMRYVFVGGTSSRFSYMVAGSVFFSCIKKKNMFSA